VVDLSPFADILPAGFPAVKYYLNVDQWDGFPLHRKALFEALGPKNVVILSGDIHAAYFTDYGADEATGNRIVELTGPGVSSGPFAELLNSTAQQVPGLAGNPNVMGLIEIVDMLMKAAFPELQFANSHVNGVVVLTATGTQLQGAYALLPPTEVGTDSTGDATLSGRFLRTTVTVPKTDGKNGTPMIS